MTGILEPAARPAGAFVVAALVAALATACGSSSTQVTSTQSGSTPSASDLAPIHGRYSPTIDPANFVATIDNRYFPLLPGTGFHYRGVAENGKTPQTDDMVVTHETKKILGVSCTVVRDTVSSRGKAIEHTFDWYAQDRQGDVWYMGEDTSELQHGKFVKADDSWQAGVDGAKAGIIMPGDPRAGDAYRQEYYPHYALDQARVLGPGASIKVPYGSYGDTLLTVETEAGPRRRGAEVVRRRRRRHQGAHGQREPRGDRARQRDALLAGGPDQPVTEPQTLNRVRPARTDRDLPGQRCLRLQIRA